MDHFTNDNCFNLDFVDCHQPLQEDAFASQHPQLNQPELPHESFCLSDFGSWGSSSSWSIDGSIPEACSGDVQGLAPSFANQSQQQLMRFDGYHETMDYSWFQSNGQSQYFGTDWNGSFAEPAGIMEPTRLPDYPVEPSASFLASHPCGDWTVTSDWSHMIGCQVETEANDIRLYPCHYHHLNQQEPQQQEGEAEKAELRSPIGYNSCQSTVREEANEYTSAVYPWMTIVGPNSGRRAGGAVGRRTYTRWQRLELEKEFRFDRFLTVDRRSLIAHRLQLTERQVKLWFQNRRMKVKKETERIREWNQKQQRTDNSRKEKERRQQQQ